MNETERASKTRWKRNVPCCRAAGRPGHHQQVVRHGSRPGIPLACFFSPDDLNRREDADALPRRADPSSSHVGAVRRARADKPAASSEPRLKKGLGKAPCPVENRNCEERDFFLTIFAFIFTSIIVVSVALSTNNQNCVSRPLTLL